MKNIQLSSGYETIVDDNMYEYLNQWKWFANKNNRSGKIYASRTGKVNGKYTTIHMHRVILGTPSGLSTDHIDGNSLNNLRKNLRICTQSENMANSGKHKNNTSGYKGVRFRKDRKKWQSYIKVNYQRKYLGCFNSLEVAAQVYNKAAVKYFGKFAKLNIIGGNNEKME